MHHAGVTGAPIPKPGFLHDFGTPITSNPLLGRAGGMPELLKAMEDSGDTLVSEWMINLLIGNSEVRTNRGGASGRPPERSDLIPWGGKMCTHEKTKNYLSSE